MNNPQKLQIVKNLVDDFNKLIFNNEIEINFEIKLSSAQKRGGCVRHYKHLNTVHSFLISKWCFDVTNFSFLEDVIIHELIHVYIIQKGIKDSGSHGVKFCSIMYRINEEHKRNVVERYDSSKLVFKENVKRPDLYFLEWDSKIVLFKLPKYLSLKGVYLMYKNKLNNLKIGSIPASCKTDVLSCTKSIKNKISGYYPLVGEVVDLVSERKYIDFD